MGVPLPPMLPPSARSPVARSAQQETDERSDEDMSEEDGIVMLATQGFDTQPVDDPDDQPTQAAGSAQCAGMTEPEMLAAMFDRFDADADGFLNRPEATAWGVAVADGKTMDEGTYRSLVQASLPPGESQRHDGAEPEADQRLLARGIDLPGLTRVYMIETSLNVARDYETVINSVPPPRNLNLKFYRNRCECSAGVSIEEFFRTWTGDYERLERAHNYIQWLFPSPEASMFNYNSQPLTQHEAEVMRRDPSIQRRLKRSVALFLDFLGLQIDFEANTETGAITRGTDAPSRLLNVETNPHNFLRISRMVRCMGEVGMHRWQRPILAQLAKEVFQTGALRSAAESYCNHWLTHVSSADDRKALEGLIPDSDDEAEEAQHNSGEQDTEMSVVRAASDHARQEDEPATQAPMTQPLSPVSSTEDSALQAASDPSIDHAREDTGQLEVEASSEAHGQGALHGSRIFVDPQSYSRDEVQDLMTELLTNGAIVVGSIAGDSLSACTHVLCECERTDAFKRVEGQPDDCDVICVNGRWLQMCIRQNRLVGLDRDSAGHVRFLPHCAAKVDSNESRTLYPPNYHDYWDSEHVRLPCSPHNRLGEFYSKWSLIHYHLSKPLYNLASLEYALRRINTFRKYDFTVLRNALNGFVEAGEFFATALPMMQQLCLEMPYIFAAEGVPLLESSRDGAWTISQREACCLLAAAFFCLFPGRSGKSSRRHGLPSINFDSLYEHGGYTSWGADASKSKTAKLRCVLHYFCRAAREMPDGKLTYHRRVVDTDISWLEVTLPIVPVRVVKSGLIEDADGCIQVDFANEYVGGGVLGHGAVQEEIRFAICPELIVARLFTQKLQANEVLMVYGVERFCTYSGYGSSFQCTGDFVDATPKDESGHRQTVVAAMDALNFSPDALQQYDLQCCEREVGKAWAAFSAADVAGGNSSPAISDLTKGSQSTEPRQYGHRMPIASGNWGCGVFGGDHFLKALLQALAASVADRPRLDYYTVDDDELTKKLQHLFEQVAEQSMTVGEVWELFGKYRREVNRMEAGGSLSFETFLIQMDLLPDSEAGNTEEETDDAQDAGDRDGKAKRLQRTQQPVKQTQQTLDSSLPQHAARAEQLEQAARASSERGGACGRDDTRVVTAGDPRSAGADRGRQRDQKHPRADASRSAGRSAASGHVVVDGNVDHVPDSDQEKDDPLACKKRPRQRYV